MPVAIADTLNTDASSLLITHTGVPSVGNELEKLPIERLKCEILQELMVGGSTGRAKPLSRFLFIEKQPSAIAREGEHR